MLSDTGWHADDETEAIRSRLRNGDDTGSHTRPLRVYQRGHNIEASFVNSTLDRRLLQPISALAAMWMFLITIYSYTAAYPLPIPPCSHCPIPTSTR